MQLENTLNLHHLRVFQTVVRHQSFSRAAEELILSQPAVSMHVKQLEKSVGLPLFERVGRQLVLTNAGQSLYHYSQQIFALIHETSQVMEALRGGRQGRLRVSADTTAGVYVVPNYLGVYRRAHPQVEVSLEVTNRTAVVERLLLREVDLAVMGQIPEDDHEWIATPFLVNELVVIAPPDHRLAQHRNIPVTELAQETWLVREAGSGTRASMERFFDAAGVTLHVGMELGSISTIKQAVANGLGISVLSKRAIDLELKAGRLVILDVEGFPNFRYWHVVHVRDRFLPPPAKAFRELLLAEASLTEQKTSP